MLRRLTWAALLTTLAAGVVGVARQRIEAGQVARGELPRASAAADVPPRVTYGPLAARLASWVPAPPASPASRLAAASWVGPLTVIGLGLALLAGRVPRWSAEHGCFVAEGIRGPSRIALRSVGASANTVGQVVLSTHTETSPALLAHEAVHVRQGERLGPLLFPTYVWLAARYGYRDHPLERAARLGARAVVGGS